jgi:hypothetical protein
LEPRRLQRHERAGRHSARRPQHQPERRGHECQGNLTYSGAPNASLISGIDTTSLVSGFGGGTGSGANGAGPALLSKGRLMQGNTTVGRPAFSGSGFESSEGSRFIF